jgi:hypothetical protein
VKLRTFLVGGAVATAAIFGVDGLADATQTRADERHADLQTEVVVHVEGKRYQQSLDTAAWALWASCAATVPGELVGGRIEPLGAGDYAFAITPSIGHHGKERLLGCLRDLTIDRLKSSVVSVRDVPRA